MRRLWFTLVACALFGAAPYAQGVITRLVRVGTSAADVTNPTATITTNGGADIDNGSSATLTTLAGTASDNVGVTSVTWVNDTGGSGTATGTTSWSISNIALQSGANIITVTAHDAAGNTGTDTITVTYTPAGGSGNNCNAPCLVDVSFTVGQGWEADKTNAGGNCTGPGSGSTDFAGEHTGVGTIGNGGAGTSGVNCDTVITAANFSSGAGGRGLRAYRGDGVNRIGGGITLSWGTKYNNMSFCYMMRPQAGSAWLAYDGLGPANDPSYTKDWYLLFSTGGIFILGQQGSGYGVHTGANISGSYGWYEMMGNNRVADGNWKEIAIYADIPSTTVKVWVNDSLVFSTTSADFRSLTAFDQQMYNSNQRHFDSDNDGLGEGVDSAVGYYDYDDIVVDTAVSNGGKLECGIV